MSYHRTLNIVTLEPCQAGLRSSLLGKMTQNWELLQVTKGYITESMMSEPKRKGQFPVFHSYEGSELAPNGNQAGERLTDVARAVSVPLHWYRSMRLLPPSSSFSSQ